MDALSGATTCAAWLTLLLNLETVVEDFEYLSFSTAGTIGGARA